MNVFWVMIIAVFMNGELIDAGLLQDGPDEARFSTKEECTKIIPILPEALADFFPPGTKYEMECVKIEELPKGGARI